MAKLKEAIELGSSSVKVIFVSLFFFFLVWGETTSLALVHLWTCFKNRIGLSELEGERERKGGRKMEGEREVE